MSQFLSMGLIIGFHRGDFINELVILGFTEEYHAESSFCLALTNFPLPFALPDLWFNFFFRFSSSGDLLNLFLYVAV